MSRGKDRYPASGCRSGNDLRNRICPFQRWVLTYADDEGISKVYETLQSLAESDHNRFKPSSALENIYKSGKGFYDYYQ